MQRCRNARPQLIFAKTSQDAGRLSRALHQLRTPIAAPPPPSIAPARTGPVSRMFLPAMRPHVRLIADKDSLLV